MNRNQQANAYEQAADWLVGTAKANPEALLVLAAGCALLLRNRNAAPSSESRYPRYESGAYFNGETEKRIREGGGAAGRFASDLKDRVTETAGEYASSVSDTARSYATSAGDYAEDARRAVASHASRLADQASDLADRTTSAVRSGAGNVMREQPLAVALLGMAAGAALAAIFPKTEIEERTLGSAREAVTDAAKQLGENIMDAAGEAAERLKQSAAARGLSPDGMKELAKEATDTFTNKVAGKTESSAASPGASTAPPTYGNPSKPIRGTS